MKELLNIENKNFDSMEKKNLDYWKNNLMEEYFINYYKNLSSKELDKEFNRNIHTLADTLRKQSDIKKIKVFTDILSRVIEFYIENKVEKEINLSISKILKF